MNKKLILLSLILLSVAPIKLLGESSRQRSQMVENQRKKAYITVEEDGKEVTYTQEEWQKKQDQKKQLENKK